MNINEEKHNLRAALREREKALDPAYKAESDAAICRALAELPAYAAANTVLAFRSLPREVDTREFLLRVLADGKTLLLPRCETGSRLSLCVVRDLNADLEPGAMGILEPKRFCLVRSPESVDFAVIPCASFDRAGNRLGQGGGYYDRLLPRLACPTVCVCREKLRSDALPAEEHDMKCSLYLTEAGIADIASA